MSEDRMDRKAFLATLGRAGAGTCMCGAALAMHEALAGEPAKQAKPAPKQKQEAAPAPDATKPGDKSIARAAKRMEFVDAWVPRLFKVMDAELDEPTRRSLMAANGKACYSAFRPDQKPRSEPATKERIAEWVDAQGKDGYRMDGDVITMEYTSSAETGQDSPERICLCPAAETQNAKTISPTFCWCSVGYVKEMHERVFGRPVTVELVEAVLLGQPRCKFKVTLA